MCLNYIPHGSEGSVANVVERGYFIVATAVSVGERGVIRRGRIMRHTLFHANWKHLGSFHCCCHLVFLSRNYSSYRERLDLTAVLCLVHLKVLWHFLIG